MFGWNQERDENCGEEDRGGAESTLDAKAASVQNIASRNGCYFKNGIKLRVPADLKSKHVSLDEIPDRVDGSDCPNATALQHENSCKDTEQHDIHEGEEAEACVSGVEKGKKKRTEQDSISGTHFAAQRGHQVAAEQGFLSHSLNEKGDEEAKDGKRLDGGSGGEGYGACDQADQGGDRDHDGSDGGT